MAYYLGLDAGGTKTECVLAQEDTILARATGGTIKTLRASVEEATKNLTDLLQTISTQSGVPLDSITCTCVGLSGSSVPRIVTWTRQALHARVAGDILLAGDEEVALDAAFHGGAGVLVVAGTGSNFIGRSTQRELIHIGGWGPVLADEGSGNWIGRQAVRAIFDAMDRNATTLLLNKVFDYWKLENIGGLIDLANQLPSPDFSKLTSIVAECAAQKDLYASRVLREAGSALGMYAVLAAQRVQAVEPEHTGYPEIAFTGSILRHIGPVRDAMCAAIRSKLPQAQIQLEVVDSVQGALWRARQHSKAHQPTHVTGS